MAARRARRGELLWALCIAVLGVLAIEQQFGLFETFTGIVRDTAYEEHWYAERRSVQREAVSGLILAGALLGLVLLFGLRRQAWSLRMVAVATVGLLALALVKAISLHSLDAWFGRGLPGAPLTLGGGLELAGILLVLVASLMAIGSRRSR